MFLIVTGFVAFIVLLETDGLASWANRLEIGPLRAMAVPVTAAVQEALDPFGLAAIRGHALAGLAHAGWTDDAAQLAEAAHPASTVDLPKAEPSATVAAASTQPSDPAVQEIAATGDTEAPPSVPSRSAPVARAETPLLSNMPRTNELAPLPPVEPGKTRVVALTGDSMMAVGLSAALMREAAGDKNLRIVKAYRSGTGLARPEVFNWMDEYPAIIGAEKPDVVIVAIGANDGQGFEVDGKVMLYGSEDWLKVYQGRLANYLAMVSAGGARVLWVGLPPMRMPSYAVRIATINRIAYTVVSQHPEAAWLNPVPYVGDESGGFREFVTLGDGRTLRIRNSDGIHLSDEGASLMTPVLMRWLDPPIQSASVSSPAISVLTLEAQ